MLAKVVKPRPNFLSLGAVECGTAEAAVIAVRWHNLVHALLMPIEIIVGAKTIVFLTVEHIALIGLLVSKHMLSAPVLPTSVGHGGSQCDLPMF